MPELWQLHGVLLKKPAVALTLTDRQTPEQIQKAVRGARRVVPLLLEIRIDRFRRFDKDYVLEKILGLRSLGLPLIATVRSRKEGGGRPLSDARRLELFKAVLPFVRIIDIELASSRLWKRLVPLAHRKGKKIILSCHNFRGTPSGRIMENLVRKAKRAGADWVKIAVTAREKSDVARLLLFTRRHRNQNLITLSMGRLGQSSRVLAPAFGSRLTYSFIARPQAPGQIPLKLAVHSFHSEK